MDLTNCLGSTEIMLTPVGVKSDDPIFSTSVKLAGSVSPKDIEVTLAYDASLVEAYNQENGTSYLALPKGISRNRTLGRSHGRNSGVYRS